MEFIAEHRVTHDEFAVDLGDQDYIQTIVLRILRKD
jgi:hypothetical protein